MLIMTLITVVMWISFDIYRAFAKPQDPSVPANVSEPLTPVLDLDVMNKVNSDLFLDDSQIPDTVVNFNLTPQATEPEPTSDPQEDSPASESETPAETPTGSGDSG